MVLGLIFLKYISDAFTARHDPLVAGAADPASPLHFADPEDRDEYIAENIFWVPQEARWPHLKERAKQPTIGTLLDAAMSAIERDNPKLKGVLPKDYARESLNKQHLGQLIDLISTIAPSDADSGARDVLGHVYE